MNRRKIETKKILFWIRGLTEGLMVVLVTAWLFFDFERASILLILYVPFVVRKRWKAEREKEMWQLTVAFQDALLYMKNGLLAGYSPEGSVKETARGLEQLLGKHHVMTKEFHVMLSQLTTGHCMEQVFSEFAGRRRIEEIAQFSELFSIVKRTGGNLTEVIRQTSTILQEKMEVKRELHTAIAAKEAEFRIMCCIPHAILFYLKTCSPSMVEPLYHNVFGCVFMCIILLCYFGIRVLGTHIVHTEIR